MLITELIIGIDLGSTGVKGALGRKVAGTTELIALSQVPLISGVRRGLIHNIEEVTRAIEKVLDLLLKKVPEKCKVDQVYLGINGYTIRTLSLSSIANFSGEEIINEMHLDSLNDDIVDKVSDKYEIIEVFPQEFIVDGKADPNPLGSMPVKVEGKYKVVVGKPIINKNINNTFNRLNIKYELVLGPLANAEAVLDPEEKNKGVIVIDFGAQTTSVTIFKSNNVKYVVILPFGGNNITSDLMYLDMDFNSAEKYKIEQSSAFHHSTFPVSEDEEAIPLSNAEKMMNEAVVARIEEIVENVYSQITTSDEELHKLNSGIVITGGASELNGLDELLKKRTGLNVRKGNPVQNILNPNNLSIEMGDSLSIGLILLGKANCCSEKIEPKVVETIINPVLGEEFAEPVKKEPKVHEPKPPVVKKAKTPGKVSEFWKKIFIDDEDV